MDVATLVYKGLGSPAQVAVRAYDRSGAGDGAAPAVVVVHSVDALHRIAGRPGELGLARAYVAGDLDVEGDIYELLDAVAHRDSSWVPRELWPELARLVPDAARRRLPPPPEEARPTGLLHSRSRDARAISHHYDVSNDFYALVLGPSMTYSCALFDTPDTSLEHAQQAKHELVAGKHALTPDTRLLDVGCGWGGMVMHAAATHRSRAVGVTISRAQADLAAKRVAEAGLANLVDIRLQDYRDVADGPYDAISSIGMFEHVGRARLGTYVRRLHSLLRPGGRLLNHAISRPGEPEPPEGLDAARATYRRVGHAAGSRRSTRIRSPFMERYVFPDGELLEVGNVVSMLQELGFEVRHVESLREHYALTLRHWVANLERNWDEAVALSSPGRARVWRLYMAGSALGFENGNLAVHQVLAVKPDAGASGFPLRPAY
ncbi:MAG TPA: cyclopropane-fatty-acyl-phospholipid synthase family protein [Acidimicrobiales bacterium]